MLKEEDNFNSRKFHLTKYMTFLHFHFLFKVNYSQRILLYNMMATLQVYSIGSRINVCCQALNERLKNIIYKIKLSKYWSSLSITYICRVRMAHFSINHTYASLWEKTLSLSSPTFSILL
jgi:hypothetical protein